MGRPEPRALVSRNELPRGAYPYVKEPLHLMARGPDPKPRDQRRNRTEPTRGEWVDLEPLDKPILPAYQGSMSMPRWMWDGWRQDPITSEYTEGDIRMALYLAREWALMTHAERRQLLVALGMTPKGRRDLRFRTQKEAEQQREAVAKVKQLRIAS